MRTNERFRVRLIFSCLARAKKNSFQHLQDESDWWQVKCTVCALHTVKDSLQSNLWTFLPPFNYNLSKNKKSRFQCVCVLVLCSFFFIYFVQNDLTLSIAANIIYYFVFPPICFSLHFICVFGLAINQNDLLTARPHDKCVTWFLLCSSLGCLCLCLCLLFLFMLCYSYGILFECTNLSFQLK